MIGAAELRAVNANRATPVLTTGKHVLSTFISAFPPIFPTLVQLYSQNPRIVLARSTVTICSLYFQIDDSDFARTVFYCLG
jgi:hypothetical protein